MIEMKMYTDEEIVAAFNNAFRKRGMAHRLVIVDGHVIHKDLTPEEIEQERKELGVAMTEELKPCPCCRSTKIHEVAPDDGCYCWDCGLTMPNRLNWRERWNRRVNE